MRLKVESICIVISDWLQRPLPWLAVRSRNRYGNKFGAVLWKCNRNGTLGIFSSVYFILWKDTWCFSLHTEHSRHFELGNHEAQYLHIYFSSIVSWCISISEIRCMIFVFLHWMFQVLVLSVMCYHLSSIKPLCKPFPILLWQQHMENIKVTIFSVLILYLSLTSLGNPIDLHKILLSPQSYTGNMAFLYWFSPLI